MHQCRHNFKCFALTPFALGRTLLSLLLHVCLIIMCTVCRAALAVTVISWTLLFWKQAQHQIVINDLY